MDLSKKQSVAVFVSRRVALSYRASEMPGMRKPLWTLSEVLRTAVRVFKCHSDSCPSVQVPLGQMLAAYIAYDVGLVAEQSFFRL